MQMLTCNACGGLTPSGSSSTCLHCDVPLRAPRWAVKLTSLLGPAGAILLAACYGGPGRYADREPYGYGVTRPDRDGDGALGDYECQSPTRCEELRRTQPLTDLDCDDNDRTRYPGAQDVDGDSIDQNCDGVDGWRDPNTAAQPAPASPPATIATPPDGDGSGAAPPR